METIRRALIITIIPILGAHGVQAAVKTPRKPVSRPMAPAVWSASAACAPSGERWSLPAVEQGRDWAKEFTAFLKKKRSAARGFAEALALRQKAATPEEAAIAEYWISRALLDAGMIHIAHSGFSVISSREVSPRTAGVQSAAFECLVRIHESYPTLSIPDAAAMRLPDLLMNPAFASYDRGPRLATLLYIEQRLSEGHPPEKLLKLLVRVLDRRKEGGASDLAAGIVAVRFGEFETAERRLRLFTTYSRLDPSLQRFRDPAFLLLARTQYSLGDYSASVRSYQSVSRTSNELIHALSELSWAFLMNDQYKEAIGTALNLQTGSLQATFAPEAPMVMAIALNELCQFPESIRSIESFRQQYRPTFDWLLASRKNHSIDPYGLAIAYVKDPSTAKRRGVPEKVLSEWIRSPLFISRQEEINLIIAEASRGAKLEARARNEQQTWTRSLVESARELKKRYLRAQVRLGPGDQLPREIVEEITAFQEEIRRYNRFRAAAPFWRRILASHKPRAQERRKNLVAEIRSDLRAISNRMIGQLEEIAENNQLIEVEIFQGATQDIIWQNAHPDYREVANELDPQKRSEWAQTTLNWGKVADSMYDKAEVWEDELGSFKVDVYDNCENRERYLALKRSNGHDS